MAAAWAGNGLELVHSKVVSKGVYMALCTALGVVFSCTSLPGMEAWYDLEFSRGFYAGLFGTMVVLPLVCRTSRMFEPALQRWIVVLFLGWWAPFVVCWVATGQWALAAFWAPVLSANVVVINFRKGLFIRFFAITIVSGFVLQPAVACVYYDAHLAGPFATFAGCASATYTAMVPLLLVMGSYLLLRIGSKFVNDALV